jgi:hypothetical protein
VDTLSAYLCEDSAVFLIVDALLAYLYKESVVFLMVAHS